MSDFLAQPRPDQVQRGVVALDAICSALMAWHASGTADDQPMIEGLRALPCIEDVRHLCRQLSSIYLLEALMQQLCAKDVVAWAKLGGWMMLPGNKRTLLTRIAAVRQRLLETPTQLRLEAAQRQEVAA